MSGTLHSMSPPVTFLHDVTAGMSKAVKTLPSKYLYDQRGSELFDEICELDEYYLTRAELQIMRSHSHSIATQIGPGVMLVEYGSGSSVKTRLLLDALDQPVAYVPVDISRDHLLRTAEELAIAYPSTEILPVVADFTKPFELPESRREPSHVAVYFSGSTIGNFTHDETGRLLTQMASMLGEQGGLLLGIDLQKDVSTIQAAYDDEQGVTSEFSLNLLTRINRELGADFDVCEFRHEAIYNPLEHRIEISIVSCCDQTVTIADQGFTLREGERILTEYSHKYTIEGFSKFAQQFGFSLHQSWTAKDGLFAVLHLVLESAITSSCQLASAPGSRES